MTTVLEIFSDGLLAAVAGIGFGAISNPPRMALKYCGLIAAFGHMTRYCMINLGGMHIVPASLAGAFVVGLLAIICAKRVKCPPETFAFPALLPMIPGIYAYKTIQAFLLALPLRERRSSIIFCIFASQTALYSSLSLLAWRWGY